MPQDDLKSLALAIAHKQELDGSLVCAVCEQESSWDQWSMRYEPDFKIRYVDPLGLDPTSSVGRSISWGLMQVMGQVAREAGYLGPFPGLCLPLNGITIGCQVLKHKMAAANGDIRKTLLLWNGGSNQRYPDEVMGRMAKYKILVTDPEMGL